MASAGKIDSVSMLNNTQYVIQKMDQPVPKKGAVRPKSDSPDDKVERKAKKPRTIIPLDTIAGTVSAKLKKTLGEIIKKRADDGSVEADDGSVESVVPIKHGHVPSLIYLRAPRETELPYWGSGPTTTSSTLARRLQFDGRVVFAHTPTSYKGYETKQHMRWVSTVFANLVKASDEIQCYFDGPSKTIIVSANLNTTLKSIKKLVAEYKTLGDLKKLFKSADARKPRSKAHISELEAFSDYDTFHIRTVDPPDTDKYREISETDGMHAEVRIVLELLSRGSPFDIDNIGGFRVPCLCCAVVLLKASSVDKSRRKTFLSGRHPICRIGPLWPSNSAVKGVLTYFWTIGKPKESLETIAENKIMKMFRAAVMTVTAVESNKSQIYRLRTDQDCDSETESED